MKRQGMKSECLNVSNNLKNLLKFKFPVSEFQLNLDWSFRKIK